MAEMRRTLKRSISHESLVSTDDMQSAVSSWNAVRPKHAVLVHPHVLGASS